MPEAYPERSSRGEDDIPVKCVLAKLLNSLGPQREYETRLAYPYSLGTSKTKGILRGVDLRRLVYCLRL